MAGKSARWKVGEMVRVMLFGRTKAEEAKVRVVVGKQIREEVLPAKEECRDKKLEQIAWLIVHHPKLRAEYFDDPEELLEDYYPASTRRSLARPLRRLRAVRLGDSDDRQKLALLIELLINDDPRLISAKETFHERESFLGQGVQDPEKTFGAVARMSVITFVLGVALVFVGVGLAAYGVFFADGTDEQVMLAAVGAFFGGSGVVTTLLAVFKASTKELRTITSDLAKIHMILTGYGAETTNLRKIEVRTREEASVQNMEFRKITEKAVSLLRSDAPPAAQEEATESKPSFLQRLMFWRPET